jgi:hypothetical protein
VILKICTGSVGGIIVLLVKTIQGLQRIKDYDAAIAGSQLMQQQTTSTALVEFGRFLVEQRIDVKVQLGLLHQQVVGVAFQRVRCIQCTHCSTFTTLFGDSLLVVLRRTVVLSSRQATNHTVSIVVNAIDASRVDLDRRLERATGDLEVAHLSTSGGTRGCTLGRRGRAR